MRPLLGALAILLLAPALAEAGVFKGWTSQDLRARVETTARGLPIRFDIEWHRRCSDGGRIETSTAFLSPFDERSRTAVRDVGSYSFRLRDSRGGYVRVRVKRTNLVARRVARRRWEGTFGARAVVRKNGRVIARCRTGTITWRASR